MQVEIEPHSKVYDKNNRLKSEKMNKKYFKIAAILLFIGVITTGCGSRRNQPQSAVVDAVAVNNLPFTTAAYRSNDTHWRGVGNSISTQLAMGRRVATQNARTVLAQEIETQVRVVTQSFANHEQVQMDTEEAARFQEMSIAVTNETLNDVRVIGEQVFRLPDGRLDVHIALEMSKDAVGRAIVSRISADDRMRLRFDEYQFRRVFDEEMRNFENR